jgi:hypothetical protein
VTTGTAIRQLTILVPTRNEPQNVEPLLKRIAVRHPDLVRSEIPFAFGGRVTDQSKGTFGEVSATCSYSGRCAGARGDSHWFRLDRPAQLEHT